MSIESLTAAFHTRPTGHETVDEKIPGTTQVQNNGGGYGWEADAWARLDRFLILGSEGGSYYQAESELTIENAKNVVELVQSAHGLRVVRRIVEMSTSGRAPKSAPLTFALAICAKLGDPLVTRRAAYAALPQVCRTGAQLFEFAQAVLAFGSFSSGTQRAVARWYNDRPAHALAYQVVKYQSRGSMSHRDILRMTKPSAKERRGPNRSPEHDAVFEWVARRRLVEGAPPILHAFTEAQVIGQSPVSDAGASRICKLIGDLGLPREAIPTEYLGRADVWEALLHNGGRGMPLWGLVRSLNKMTAVGLLGPLAEANKKVVELLGDVEAMRRQRFHPLRALVGGRTYAQGHGIRGSLTWTPVPQIVDALDAAFYRAFPAAAPTGKSMVLALDVSGSMAWSNVAGVAGLSPREASAALALVTAATEPNHVIVGFSTELVQIDISPRMRINDVMRTISEMSFGATDIGKPFEWARTRRLPVDAFVAYTDNEVNSGTHPALALARYRKELQRPARSVFVAMTAGKFSVSDPNDPWMIDYAGFDAGLPELISVFVGGATPGPVVDEGTED